MGILLLILLTLQNSPHNRQPLAVRNVAMRVGEKLEKIYMHPATFVHVWIEMQFDLANINSKPVILKEVRVHYRIPPGWRVGATSPMSGSIAEKRYVYSIELGAIAPGKFMHRKQGIGFEPPRPIIEALDKINLHTLNHNTYPISLTWQIDYQVDGKPGTKEWCWMVDYKSDVPRPCPAR